MTVMKGKMVGVSLPPAYIEGLNELVKAGMYANRGEAIRDAVRDMLKEELWSKLYEHNESDPEVKNNGRTES